MENRRVRKAKEGKEKVLMEEIIVEEGYKDPKAYKRNVQKQKLVNS